MLRFVADLFMCQPKPTRSITRYLNHVSADHAPVLCGIASIAGITGITGIADVAGIAGIAGIALVLHSMRVPT